MSSGHTSLRQTGLPHTVVFFDGVCALCNGFVDFLVRHDHREALRFAPLQGTTAASFAGMPTDVDSVVVVHDGRTFIRSTAALVALGQLGGAWRLLGALRLVPRPLRDAVYAYIARHRYAWFGRRDACRLPEPHEARWFLP